MDEVNNEIFGVPIDEDEKEYYSFQEQDILFIKKWTPKRKYEVPLFVTKKGTFTIALTLDACHRGLRSFDYLSRGSLADMSKVKQVLNHEKYGLLAEFEGTKISTKVSPTRLDKLNFEVDPGEPENKKVLVSSTLEKGYCLLPLSDVLYIDICEPKRDYQVPRYHTAYGAYITGLTLKACKQVFPNFAQMDTGLIVNIENIESIDNNGTISFFDSKITTTMAAYKVKYYRKMLDI
ncbi:LytTR family transcriptional regulator DNA-binding domain-containing protein [Paenibacillus alvei]|nr:LytTR family transcriptional regulator DNA-binding domain-containing protein [Paenibacillus alvei]MCY9708397.1 LytTR family transcriptional regulator DNA-binding domain-containing protein [Paenibacillus alvei]MCY9732277.1 LytTR family transcriptional regulator DNA-binding domain-containing protein [Paenibacillus alvei]MCY9753872.1 LytTR family transcriptional regulator DNA-binding domain-containing protein [Paenibacillus alvei]MCY9769431.1 LytTR family transcriptional regulator DNA-binding d